MKKLIFISLMFYVFPIFGKTISFVGSTPQGWKTDGLWDWESYQNIRMPRPGVFYSDAGTTASLVMSDSIEDVGSIGCDNVSVTLKISNNPANPERGVLDKMAVYVSKNADFSGSIQVGETVECYQKGAGVWGVYSFQRAISGIKDWSSIYFKVVFTAAHWSQYYIFVNEFTYEFLPGATPETPEFTKYPVASDSHVNIESKVLCEPAEDISLFEKDGVVAKVKRNGDAEYSVQMDPDPDRSGVFSCDVLKDSKPPIDAGERFEISVETKYTCETEALGVPIGPNQYKEISKESLPYVVPKLGSVWINEISDTEVELCGTTNRKYICGWSIVFSNETGAVTNSLGSKSKAFDFSGNMTNGVIGFLSFPIPDRQNLSGTYSVVLLNSAGIAETKPRSITFPVSGSWGMSGMAQWHGSFGYDWDGVGLSDVFDWVRQNEPTVGFLNDGQFFETVGNVKFNVYAYIPGKTEDEDVCMSGVPVDIGLDMSKGYYHTNVTTSANGWFDPDVEVQAVHTNTMCLNADFSASVFGWRADIIRTNLVLSSDGVVSNRLAMLPSTGDFKNDPDFNSGKLINWENRGVMPWNYSKDSGGILTFNARTVGPNETAILQCKNYLMAAGKRLVNFSFRVKNDIEFEDTRDRVDTAEVVLSQSPTDFSKDTISSPRKGNKNIAVADRAWMPCQFVRCLDGNTVDAKLYLRIIGRPAAGIGWSNATLDIKDFRIAFQDMVTIETNGVENIIDGAVAGSTELTFNAKLKPWATEAGVSNVSAYVVYSVDEGQSWSTNYFAAADAGMGVKTVLTPNAHFQLTTPTNIQSVVALKNPLEGWDGVKYYFGVDYFADNRDPDPARQYEKRYWPDNAKVDANGVWCCEDLKGYEHGVTSAEISGEPAFFTVGGQEQGTNSLTVTFRLHDDNGIENASITINGVTSNFVITAGTKTFTGTITKGGLDSNTSYEVTISGNDGRLSATTNFWTLATAAAPTLCARTADSLTVKAEGCQAEKIKFSCTSAVRSGAPIVVESVWISPHESYPFTNLPESDGSNVVTVAWVRNGAGVETATSASDLFFTMPAAPTESVTTRKGAEWDSYVVYVTNITGYAAGAFGNASDAHYALFVEGVGNDGKPVATNWFCDIKGEVAEYATQENLKWQTLEEWNEQPIRLSLTTTETNLVYLVAGGRDGKVNGYDPTGADPTQKGCLVEFSLALEKFRKGDMPVQADGQDGTYGYVTLTNKMMSPFRDGIEDASVTYDFSVDGGEWKSMTLNAANCVMDGGADPKFDANVVSNIISSACISNAVAVTWDAAKDLERGTNYTVTIRATMHDGYHSDVAVTYDHFLLDLEPPKATVSFAKTLTNANPIEFTVTLSDGLPGNLDAETVYLASDNQFTVVNGSIVEGGITGKGLNYTVKVNPKQAVCDVTLTVNEKAFKDKVGNDNDASNGCMVKYDHSAPTDLEINGEIENGAVTKATNFEFTALAKDDNPPITYTWTFGDRKATEAEGVPFTGDNLDDGIYTVSVYATDAAGNISASTNRTWTVDTHSPSNLAFGVCTPTNGSVVATDAFSFTATAMDATELEYRWILNGKVVKDFTASTFTNSGDVAVLEGTNTVEVCAEDAAGNVSVTNSLWWVYDKTPPDEPKFTDACDPKNGDVTNDPAYRFAVTSKDNLSDFTCYWKKSWDDAVVAGLEISSTMDDEANGDFFVDVWAEDAAGNVSTTNRLSWKLDQIAPELLPITGTPTNGQVTAERTFDFTGHDNDKIDITDVTFHWLTNGVWAADVTNLTDKVVGEVASEGLHTYSVYATDAAGNVSATTNSVTWTVDWTAPTNLVISGDSPANGSTTNLTTFSLSATAMDLTTPTFHWSFDDGKETLTAAGEKFENSAEVEDGAHTVACYAVDEALNVSETNFWNWTVDTTVPTNFVLVGTPGDGAITTSTNFNFYASAMDATKLTYHWTLTGKEWGNTSSNYSGVVSEGTNWVSVFARDEVGNECKPTNWTWIVDYTPPVLKAEIDGTPSKLTKNPDFTMTALATDKWTQMTYHWTFNDTPCADVKGAVFASSAHPAKEGTNTVSVYVTDEVGNVSTTNSYEWVLDTIHPSVTLESDTPSHFNTEKCPMLVTVTFSETVTNFTANSVLIVGNGCISNVEEVVKTDAPEKSVYLVTIWPTRYRVKLIQDDITVSIDEGVVADYAGNPNVASAAALTRTYDTKVPTVEFEYTTSEFFNTAPMTVTVKFLQEGIEQPKVEVFGFSDKSFDVENGEVKWTEVVPNNTYSLEIQPLHDGEVSVLIPEDAVTNSVGNGNAASIPLVRTYDATPPEKLNVTGLPISDEETIVTNGFDFAFTATAEDMTALTFHWATNGVDVTDCTSSNFVGQVAEGTNTVSVYAKDAAGNVCKSIERTWVVDVTDPTVPVIEGTPGDGAVTSNVTFRFTAESKDATEVTYHWALKNGESEVQRGESTAPTAFFGSVKEGYGIYTLNVYATDQAGNESDATNWTWTVDTIKPTDLNVRGLPISDEKIIVTNGFDFAFTATASDDMALKFHWATNGVEVTDCTSSNFVGQVAEGTNTVTVYAKDVAGNVCDPIERIWVVDTIDPTVPVIEGAPGDGGVTSNVTFSFTAESKDATVVTYTWELSDGQKGTGKAFSGSVAAGYNNYTMSVCATDEAGNQSSTNWAWTVDTIKPTAMNVTGLPIGDNPKTIIVTNGFDFALTASATDHTALKFHWATNGVEVTDCTSSNFVGQVGEGTNTVSVYAKDAAGNVCDPIERMWVVDTIDPTMPVAVSCEPESNSTVRVAAFAFEVESTDATKIDYHWTLNGEAADTTAAALPGNAIEGTNTVSVYATDEAGNVSTTNSWQWTLDTIDPTITSVEGTPGDGAVTSNVTFSFSVESTDATAVTYAWELGDGQKGAGKAFSGSVKEGYANYMMTVTATDAAGNQSTTNWAWTVDTIKPTDLNVTGLPISDEKIIVTNGFDFAFTATANDDMALKFYWATNGVEVTDCTSSNFVGQVAEGTNTVTVYAKDVAGNVCDPIERIWVVDTIDPTVPVIEGAPGDGGVTSNVTFSFTAESKDATVVTYAWELSDGQRGAGKAFSGSVAAGYNNYTMSVCATDEAGNQSSTNWSWTVDTKKPERLNVTGLPIADNPKTINLTNGCDFAFLASASDDTALTYHWTTNNVPADCTTSNFVGQVAEGTNTVTVYAKDVAGNVCDPIERTWVVDITLPTVTLSTDPELEDRVINLADVTPNGFKVKVEFSEPVEGFKAASFSITNGNGTVTAIETNSAALYTVWVMPDHDGLVSFQIADGAVKDLAGNDNVASDVLERTCDITLPTVTLDGTTFDPYTAFNAEDTSLIVTVTFSEPVTNFTAELVSVENGKVDGEAKKLKSTDGTSEVYEVTIAPEKDGEVIVEIAANVVADAAGNPNMSLEEPLKRLHDQTPPTKPVISGTPAPKATAKSFAFSLTAESTDTTSGVGDYWWSVNGCLFVMESNTLTESATTWAWDETADDVVEVKVRDLLVEGTNTVTVSAMDKTGCWLNKSEESDEYTWTIELEPSENVKFGDDSGVFLRVDPETGATNDVRFTMVDFHPGETSTFTLSGFEVEPPTKTDITDLQMWFIVCDTLTGTRWPTQVDEKASYEAGELTVTIPKDGTTNKKVEPAKPYESLFIFGVDNKGLED